MKEERHYLYEKKTKTPEQALASLMRLCARAEKSSGDAMRMMRQWGVDEKEREGVLARLTSEKFIDDSRFARAYVREKSNLGGWGVHKISRALAAKGITKCIIEESLEPYMADQQERLRTLLTKKKKRLKASTPYDMKGKLMRYGLGQGYSYSDVIEVVERIIADNE